MSKSTDRHGRRQKHLERRRRRQFIEILRGETERAKAADERRPPETAVTRVHNIIENGVGLTDTISATQVTDPGVKYTDADRGYGTEYGSFHGGYGEAGYGEGGYG